MHEETWGGVPSCWRPILLYVTLWLISMWSHYVQCQGLKDAVREWSSSQTSTLKLGRYRLPGQGYFPKTLQCGEMIQTRGLCVFNPGWRSCGRDLSIPDGGFLWTEKFGICPILFLPIHNPKFKPLPTWVQPGTPSRRHGVDQVSVRTCLKALEMHTALNIAFFHHF